MNLSHWLWVATAAYGIHALEEFMLDWRNWARAVIGLPVEWDDFYVVNFLVIVLGIVAASLAVAVPWVALGFAALMIINAVFFHVLPMITARGRYSPGAATAVVFFLPIAIAAYWEAASAGLLDAGTVIGSLLIGAGLMASPVVLLKLRDMPYFRQDRP
jgi:hypothetical protein